MQLVSPGPGVCAIGENGEAVLRFGTLMPMLYPIYID